MTPPDETGGTLVDNAPPDPDFMLSLARGLSVLRAFEHRRAMTTSQASEITGLPRATARRCLHTLR